MKFLLADLETTGLDPDRCRVIEVAARLLEPGKELARYHSLVGVPENGECWEPVALDMHRKSGLWREATACVKTSIVDVDAELAQFIEDHVGDETVHLMGNSVHFDRSFMARHMRLTMDKLHYRQLDITSVRLWIMLMSGEDPYIELPKPHRAQDDVENSLTQAMGMWRPG